jgi:hypothetical protein
MITNYQLYLLGPDLFMQATGTFSALNDVEAEALATLIFRASSDIFEASELYRGDTRIMLRRRTDDFYNARNEQLIGITIREDALIQFVERLRGSFSCVRRSRALIKIYKELLEHRWLRSRSAPQARPILRSRVTPAAG